MPVISKFCFGAFSKEDMYDKFVDVVKPARDVRLVLNWLMRSENLVSKPMDQASDIQLALRFIEVALHVVKRTAALGNAAPAAKIIRSLNKEIGSSAASMALNVADFHLKNALSLIENKENGKALEHVKIGAGILKFMTNQSLWLTSKMKAALKARLNISNNVGRAIRLQIDWLPLVNSQDFEELAEVHASTAKAYYNVQKEAHWKKVVPSVTEQLERHRRDCKRYIRDYANKREGKSWYQSARLLAIQCNNFMAWNDVRQDLVLMATEFHGKNLEGMTWKELSDYSDRGALPVRVRITWAIQRIAKKVKNSSA